MTEQLVSGCINHKDLRHIRTYYDYMAIYKNNEHKAKIIRILETWTNHKRTEWYKANYDRLEEGKPVEKPDFWISMSYGQFREFMRFTANPETIRKNLAELEKDKHVLRRVNPDNPYGSPQYLLNCTVIQKAIDKLAPPSLDLPEMEEEVTPPSVSPPPPSFTPTQGVVLPLPRGQNEGESPPSFTPTQGAKVSTSNNTSKESIDSSKDNNREREVADATARSQSSSQNNLSEETEKREVVKPSQKDVAHVQNQTHSGNPGNSSQPHLDTDRNSIPLDASLTSQKGHRDGNNHLSPGSHHSGTRHHASSDIPSPSGDTHGTTPSQSPKDTNKVTEPPAPRKPPTNPVPRRPKQQGLMDELPSTPASKPVEPHAEMTWGTRKCLQWFDYWRGGTLIAKWKLQQAASFAKGLVEQFDEKTVVEIYGDMAKDPYYIERGGPDIGDVANNIHKYLNKKKPKKEPSNEHRVSSFGTPGYNFADEFYPSEAEKKAYYAAHPQGVKS